MTTARLIDGHPWGWGATKVDSPETGWRCQCGWVAKRRKDGSTRRGRHFLADGRVVCTDCARAADKKGRAL